MNNQLNKPRAFWMRYARELEARGELPHVILGDKRNSFIQWLQNKWAEEQSK